MRNLKVTIAYNGAAYHGFQRQTNAVTVQETVENAVSKLFGKETPITGCSRTDAGVHAKKFCFNAKTDSAIPNSGFIAGINALLPGDIAVLDCEDTEDGFHARYSCKAKEYSYIIHTGRVRDVFMKDRAYFYPYSPKTFSLENIELMREAAQLFVGEHDFSAYCKAESLELIKAKKRGAVREIYSFWIKTSGKNCELVEFTVKGDGFLHNMVRIMVGTLVNAGEGKMTLGDIVESLIIGANRSGKSGSVRKSAGITLPPQGLYLNEVYY